MNQKKTYAVTAVLFIMSICGLTASAEEAAKKKAEGGQTAYEGHAYDDVTYEESLPNLLVPSNLNPLQVEFVIQHRFEGAVADQPLKNFFGAEAGAAVRLGLRFMIWSKLEVNASRNFDRQEWEAGLSYAFFIPGAYLKLQLDAQYLNYKYRYDASEFLPAAGDSSRVVNDYFLQLAVSTYPLGGYVTPVINVGYDGFNRKRVGLGVGLSVKIVHWLYVQGEFFPNFFRDSWKGTEAGRLHSYAFGVMIQTKSHNFTIMAGNTTHIGTRQLMMGCDEKSVKIGFNITKVL
jgi:hypothetical protein